MRRLVKIPLIAFGSLLLLLVLLVGGFLVYQLNKPDVPVTHSAYPWSKPLSMEEAEVIADQLLKEMSLQEKVDQMTGDGVNRFLASIIMRERPAVVYAGYNERLEIPPIAFTDGPRGVVVERSTAFPV